MCLHTMTRFTALALCLLAAASTVTARSLRATQVAPASNCLEPNPPGLAGGWSPAESVPAAIYTAIATAVVESGNSTW